MNDRRATGRGLARLLALSLLLGLITTFALAWAAAPLSLYGDGGVLFGARARSVTRGEGGGIIRLNRFDTGTSTLIETVTRDVSDPQSQTSYPSRWIPEDMAPSWALSAAIPWGTAEDPWPGPGQQDRRAVRGTGWPVVAFWHEYVWRPDTTHPSGGVYVTPGGLRVERSVGMPGAWPVDYPKALPFRPVWSGLLLDTFALGIAWLAVLLVAPRLTARFRPRRGACAGCGYDRTGLPPDAPCPECGHLPDEPAPKER